MSPGSSTESYPAFARLRGYSLRKIGNVVKKSHSIILQQASGKKISSQTVRRVLWQHGYRGRIPRKRPCNDAKTDQKEETELVGSLVEKELPSEGCTGRNGEQEKSPGQKKISDDRRH
ncbi:hypothetical protein ANN_10931 [Periplaneta americana]|uniref:Transposase Tc1-like domain-containing protein n=1 Tax=Periplaneta americana TaxID=6978 RepID=A0ABQ8T4T5_PERAM|nr:hypothetical protein ANN_10931 [Periplaneta americana]